MWWWRRPRNRDDFSDEVDAHLELEEARLREAGLGAEDARAEARRQFGNVTLAVERVYDASRWRWLDALRQDVRFGLRLLRRSPAFTATAMLVLAIGIGVNTAFFSVVNAVFFRPLAAKDPASLRFIEAYSLERPEVRNLIDAETADLVAAQTHAFGEVTGISHSTSKIRVDGQIALLATEFVTQNYFSLLGIRPQVGRGIEAGDERSDAEPVALISDRVWTSRFDRDPSVIGQVVEYDLSGRLGYFGPWRSYRVVGVMPAANRGVASVWHPTDLWLPRRLHHDMPPRQGEVRPLRPRSLVLLARLQPPATDEVAQAVLSSIATSMRSTRQEPWTLALSSRRDERLPFDRARAAVAVVPERLALGLMVVAGLVFFIATTNLAGILTARGLARRGEVAVRLALGAGRNRVTRQLLTEGLLIAAAAAVPAVVLAQALVAAFVVSTPPQFDAHFSSASVSLDVPLDIRVLTFAAAVAVAAGLVVGLLPARQTTRVSVTSALSAGISGTTPSQVSRLRRWIVVPQVGASLVLLLLAAVLVQALMRAGVRDPGFDATSVFTMWVELPSDLRLASSDRSAVSRLLYQRLLDRVSATPGVESAFLFGGSWNSGLPIPTGGTWTIARDALERRAYRWVHYATATNRYFDTLRVPLRAGRVFSERDRLGSAPVAVISESAAQLHWPNQPAVGQHLAFRRADDTAPPDWVEVIGVVGDVSSPLADGWNPAAYRPAAQMPHVPGPLVVRANGRVGNVMRDVWAVAASTDVDVQVIGADLLTDRVAAALYPRRMAAAILTAAGFAGLLLAAIGLYGVVAVSVAQRTKEMGIRTALGADRRHLVRLIVRDGGRVLVWGIAGGAVMTYGAVRLASALVLPLPRFDAAALISVPAVLAVVVLTASYLPARRAARVDPVQVLRQ